MVALDWSPPGTRRALLAVTRMGIAHVWGQAQPGPASAGDVRACDSWVALPAFQTAGPVACAKWLQQAGTRGTAPTLCVVGRQGVLGIYA